MKRKLNNASFLNANIAQEDNENLESESIYDDQQPK